MTKFYLKTFMVLVACLMSVCSLSAQALDENFDDITSGVPAGWTVGMGQNRPSVNNNWAYYAGDAEHPHCVRFNYGADEGGCLAQLKTPAFILPANEHILSFEYKNPSSTQVSVQISTDGGASFVPISGVGVNSNVTVWTRVEAPLLNYVNQSNVVIMFQVQGNPNATGDASLYLDNIKVSGAPLCKKPINFYTSGMKTTEATLNWGLHDQGNDPSLYHIKVKEVGGSEIINNAALNTSGALSTQITGLTANTSYEVLLMGDCTAESKDKSDWSDAFSFTTACNAVALPFANDFSAEGRSIPACWTVSGTNASSVELTDYRSVDASPDKSIKLVATTSTDAAIATPILAHAANNMEISFKVYGEKGNTFWVALNPTPDDVTAGAPILMTAIARSNEWAEYVVNTSSLGEDISNYAVMFYLPADADKTIYIDDVKITEIPTCIRPSALLLSAVTNTSASLSWSVAQSVANYQIKLTQGTTEQIINATADTHQLTGLSSNTAYSAAVRQVCAVGDTSAWSPAVFFTTLCSPVSSLSEGFEGEAFPPACWMQQLIDGGEGSSAIYKDGAWEKAHVESAEGEYSARARYGNKGSKSILVSPYLDIPTANTHQVRFHMYRNDGKYASEQPEELKVYVNTSISTNGATLIGTVSNEFNRAPVVPEEGWYQYTYTIPTAGNQFIIFESNSQGGWHILIDQVELRQIPNCTPVQQVVLYSTTDTSAIFTWEQAATETSWTVKYKTNAMSDEMETTVTQPSFTLEGLTAYTEYNAYVKVIANCAADQVSEEAKWESTFTTECVPAYFPYYEDFEGEFDDERKICWEFPVMNTTFPQVQSKGTNQGYYLRTKGTNVAVTQAMGVDSWIGKRITATINVHDSHPMKVGVMENQIDTSTFQLIQIISTSGTHDIDITTEYAGKYIAFITSGDQSVFADIDDIRLNNTPQCPNIEMIQLQNAAVASFEVLILDDVNNEWEIQYGVGDLDLPESNATIVATTQGTTSITALTANTEYTVRARAKCDAGIGNWCDAQTVKTLCAPFAVTAATSFFEGFESGYVDGTEIAGCWTQESISGDGKWFANTSFTNQNREPYQGIWNANIKYSNVDVLIYAFTLESGKTYRFSCYARQNQQKDAVLNVSCGINKDMANGDQIIISDKQIVNGDYQRFANQFSVVESGTYYLKIKATVGITPDCISLDNILVEEVACPAVIADEIAVKEITAEQATVSTTHSATNYNIKVSSTPIDPATELGNMCDSTITGLSVVVEGLESNTEYFVYMQVVCSVGVESEWSEAASFKSSCGDVALPFIENFDNGEEDYSCWRSYNTVPVFTTEEYFSGTHSLKLTNTTVATSPFDVVSLSDKQMTARMYSNDENAVVTIGVMSDVSDVATFEVMDVVTLSKSKKWTRVFTYFDLLADPDYADFAQAKNVVFIVSEDHTVYIDDIAVDDRVSCPEPPAVDMTAVTKNSVTFQWEAETATSWEVMLGDEKEIVSTNSHTFSNLTPNTDYDFKVRVICAVGDTSLWSSNPFTTLCEDNVALPFFESFNSLANGQQLDCWINEEMSEIKDNNKWAAYSGPNSSTTAYSYDSYSVWAVDWSILQSPTFDLVTPTAAILEFDIKNEGGGPLKVYISTDGGATYADSLPGNFTNIPTFIRQKVDLAKYIGNRVTFLFKGSYGGNWQKDSRIYIDNFEVYVPSSCVMPTGVEITAMSLDSINVAIEDASDNTQWQAAIVPFGTDINTVDASQIITVNSKNFKFTNIVAALKQEVYVRSVCGAEHSRWAKSTAFITPCARYNVPYALDFEAVNALTDILCVDMLGAGAGGWYPAFNVAAAGMYGPAVSGTKSLLIEGSMTHYAYYILPEFAPSIADLSMNFVYSNTRSQFCGTLEVGLLPLTMDTEDFILLNSYPVDATSVLKTIHFIHSGYEGNGYRIAFRYKAKGDGNAITLDNISLNMSPECVAPMRVDVEELSQTTAKLSIIDNANTTWEIAYGPASAAFIDLTVIDVDTNIVEFTGLSAATTYQVYARSSCDGVPTMYTDKMTFTTECALYLVDDTTSYTEAFGTTSAGAVPTCWEIIQAEDGYSGHFPSVSADGVLQLGNGATSIAMPLFTIPANKTLLSFDAQYRGYYGVGNISVGYTNDLTDPNAIVNVFTIPASKSLENTTLDLTVFPNDAQYIVFSCSDWSTTIIDNVVVSEAPKCYVPKDIKLVSSTNNIADIAYKVGENSINVEYTIFKMGAPVKTAWSTENPLTITDLDPKTMYGISLRSACDNNGEADTTAYSEMIFFSTQQTPATLPYNGHFGDADENANWTITRNAGSNKWMISDKDPAGQMATGGMYISNNDSANNYDVSSASKSWAYRTFDLEVGVYNLSYFYKNMGAVADYLRVFLVPASLDIMEVTESTPGLIVADNGERISNVVTFSTMMKEVVVKEAGYYHLAFLWENDAVDGAQRPAAIENIMMSQISCPKVLGGDVFHVGGDTATIALKDVNSAPLAYQVVVNTDNSAITPEAIEGAYTFTTDTIALGGLTPQTMHYVRVRTICAVGDTSLWSNPIIFTTTCLPHIITYDNPFVEGFENSAPGQLAGCWTQAKAGYSLWTVNETATDKGRTPRTGAKNAFLQFSSNCTMSHEVVLEAGIQYAVSVYARQNAVDGANIKLSFENNNGENSVIADQVITDGDYQEVTGVYTATVDGIHTFALQGITTSSDLWYLSIDDIMIEQDLCPAVTDIIVSDITGNTATISWSNGASTTQVVVIRGNDTIANEILTDASEVLVEDLYPAVEYTVHVSNMCGEEASATVSTNFTTGCGVFSLPFDENFENVEVGEIPLCWNNSEGTLTNEHQIWQVFNMAGNKVMRFDSYGSVAGRTNTLKTSIIAIDDVDRNFVFDYKNPKGGAFSVYISTDAGVTYADTILDTVTNVADWTTVSYSLADYKNQNVTFIFHSVSNNAPQGDAYHYIDNIRVSCDGGMIIISDEICAKTAYDDHGFYVSAVETAKAGTVIKDRIVFADKPGECDTTYRLNLTVKQSYEIYISDQMCKGGTYNKAPFLNIKEEGPYKQTLIANNGCDSVIYLNLTYFDVDSTLTATICEGDSIEFFGAYYSETDTYTHTATVGECNAIRTLYLTVLAKEYITVENICQGDTLAFNGKEYTTTGEYTDSLKNHLGCDSILTLHLTVHGTSSLIDTTICEGTSIHFGDSVYATSGTYNYKYHSQWGCDSTATMKLTVTPAETTIVSDFVCEGREYYGYGVFGLEITEDTIIFTRGQTPAGCDTIVELHLALSPSVEVYDTVTINDGETYEFGGNDLAVAGDYDHTFKNSLDCDSTVYLHLIVLDDVSVGNIEAINFAIAPNPASPNSIVHITLSSSSADVEMIEVLDATGRLVDIIRKPEFSTNISSIKAPMVSGMYYIRITDKEARVSVGKLIVK